MKHKMVKFKVRILEHWSPVYEGEGYDRHVLAWVKQDPPKVTEFEHQSACINGQVLYRGNFYTPVEGVVTIEYKAMPIVEPPPRFDKSMLPLLSVMALFGATAHR
jgi:hypothetical protein